MFIYFENELTEISAFTGIYNVNKNLAQALFTLQRIVRSVSCLLLYN